MHSEINACQRLGCQLSSPRILYMCTVSRYKSYNTDGRGGGSNWKWLISWANYSLAGQDSLIIYINDLPDCVNHSTIRLFADECIIKFYRSIKTIDHEDTQLLQEDIDAVVKWALCLYYG